MIAHDVLTLAGIEDVSGQLDAAAAERLFVHRRVRDL